MKLYLTLIMVTSLSLAGNLVVNSDFEQPFAGSWSQSISGASIIIDQATGYDPDPNYEAQVYKGAGSGYAKLYQRVDLQNMALSGLQFSCSAKFYAWDNDYDNLCWGATAVIISYLDQAGTSLGETRICQITDPCDWINTSTCHLITCADSLWHNYSFNIATELTNLPGVSPSNVKKIEVALYDTTYHSC